MRYSDLTEAERKAVIPTERHIEAYIRAADDELGPCCADPWVEWCREILRKAIANLEEVFSAIGRNENDDVLEYLRDVKDAICLWCHNSLTDSENYPVAIKGFCFNCSIQLNAHPRVELLRCLANGESANHDLQTIALNFAGFGCHRRAAIISALKG